ncbi:DegT/DnrJ/EryC1/StrS family aminotransferase [Helicobacter sp. 11S02596-1]|uniref:DegT/DnrJ/EryC1/StrS family aminotransferase n=1 Tax=Helicobacter sp. 11S02596-1 TaxID=1476194 RepID=UPI000BA4F43A|nr:DegT/DnrJ/EryC1/StrS family aminotransferase [Helicobacter sp. 11S02596-1]PAF45205.1 aminotransferase DegT [Helicobacter sp. 11S02596-1]
MKIDFANLAKAHEEYQSEIDEAIKRVLGRACFIMGEEVALFEEELKHFIGSKHAITCSSGTSAILLALLGSGIGRGDEVITTPFSFIAAAEMIALIGAKPVFVDIDPDTFHIDTAQIPAHITPKTKAIIPVSLFGLPADMETINAIAKAHNLIVIEDGAQSFGATSTNQAGVCKKSPHHSGLGVTSFFPAKPLGCYGDGGAVFCDDDRLADKIRALRIHGQSRRYQHAHIGINARLDSLQAAILRVKLKHYPAQISRRQKVAKLYEKYLANKPLARQKIPKNTQSVYAQYAILSPHRDKLEKNLTAHHIPYAIHYPKPLHLQDCFAYLGYQAGDFEVCERVAKQILSLPMNPYLSEEEIAFICECVI